MYVNLDDGASYTYGPFSIDNAVNQDRVCGNTQAGRRVKLDHGVSACTGYMIS